MKFVEGLRDGCGSDCVDNMKSRLTGKIERRNQLATDLITEIGGHLQSGKDSLKSLNN
jgi:hypothetical protein